MINKDYSIFDIENFKTYDDAGKLNEGVYELNICDVKPNANQPRKNFDSQAIKELSKSIKHVGVIQPIVVIKDDNKYTIVTGERRYRAAKEAGLSKIPAIVRELTKKQIDEIALIENIQRQDLNPIEEAEAYKRLIDEYGFTQEELASKMGKSRPTITNSLRLLSLSGDLKSMVISGRLSEGHARALLSIVDEDTQKTLAKAACDRQMSVRQLETVVHNKLNPENKKTIKPVLPVEIKRLVNTMQRVFATNVKAIGNGNRGRIYIDYYTQDDLDRIIEMVDLLRKSKHLD